MLILKVIFTAWAISAGLVPAEWKAQAGVSGSRYELNLEMASPGLLRLPSASVNWTQIKNGDVRSDYININLNGLVYQAPVSCDNVTYQLVKLGLNILDGELSTSKIGGSVGSSDLIIQARC